MILVGPKYVTEADAEQLRQGDSHIAAAACLYGIRITATEKVVADQPSCLPFLRSLRTFTDAGVMIATTRQFEIALNTERQNLHPTNDLT